MPSPLSSLAFCLLLERRDGIGVALTSSDQEIVVDGIPHQASRSFTPAAVIRTSDVTQDSTELEGLLRSGALQEADLLAERWDGAQVTLSSVDWSDPAAPRNELLKGTLGEICDSPDGTGVDVLGPGASLANAPCPSTTPECRAEFGDRACRVNLANRSTRVRVIWSDGSTIRFDQAIHERFRFGRLRWVTGPNTGFQTSILDVTDGEVRLRKLTSHSVEPGHSAVLLEGCDKRLQTCVDRFANATNFRGEPHLPGHDLLTRYPGA